GLGRVGQAFEQTADGFLALFAADPELVEPLRAGVAGGGERRMGAVLHPLRGGTDEPRLRLGAGKERGDQRPRRDAAGERDQRRLAERIGRTAARILIGADGALARRVLRLRAGLVVAPVSHWLSPYVVAWIRLCGPCAICASRRPRRPAARLGRSAARAPG